MPRFILKYPEEIVESEDFHSITKTVRAKGYPSVIKYDFGDRFYEVDLQTGRFNINGVLLNPTSSKHPLTDLTLEYRPIWKIYWVRYLTSQPEVSKDEKIYYLGWQITHNGNNYQKILQIYETGEIGFG